MAEDRRLPLVSFTGSTAIGRQVGVTVQKRLGMRGVERPMRRPRPFAFSLLTALIGDDVDHQAGHSLSSAATTP